MWQNAQKVAQQFKINNILTNRVIKKLTEISSCFREYCKKIWLKYFLLTTYNEHPLFQSDCHATITVEPSCIISLSSSQTQQVKEKPVLSVHACTFLNAPWSLCLWLSCQDAERYASGHHLRVEQHWHAVIGLWAIQASLFVFLFIVYVPCAGEILLKFFVFFFNFITIRQPSAAARNN